MPSDPATFSKQQARIGFGMEKEGADEGFIVSVTAGASAGCRT